MNERARATTKGQRTRRRILAEAAVLFNVRGVAGASMADVSIATGLEKGGVYNHFASKDELALEAFDYAAGLVRARLEAAFASGSSPLGRLRAFLDAYRTVAERPLLKGGCPILNSAVESDDTNPELRRRVRQAVQHWRALIVRAVEDGMRCGEIRRVDAGTVATMLVAGVEGGVMLGKLFGSMAELGMVLDQLDAYVASLAAEP